MRNSKHVVQVVLLFLIFTAIVQSGAEAAEDSRMVFPLVPLEIQTNFIVLADWDHPQACGTEWTNTLANTNLFTASEAARLELIKQKYKNITTNSGPAGTLLKGVATRRQSWRQFTNTFLATCFVYTNSTDRVEIVFPTQASEYFWVKHRTMAEDGYNAVVIDKRLCAYQEFKNARLDGLWCQMYEDGKISSWVRFEKGKSVGQYLKWDDEGSIRGRTLFQSPFDLVKHAVANVSMDWEDVVAEKSK